MGKKGCTFTTRKPGKPVWNDIAAQYPADRDCLAAFIALNTAEVLDGAKPSSLVNLANRRHPCGRNFYALWKEHGSGLIGGSRLKVLELVDRGDSLLLLLYDYGSLERLLSGSVIKTLLRKSGYTGNLNVESVLYQLQTRLSTSDFPHEIGILLGYPLKDVAGFMGWGRLPFSCQGPWKIYGDPRESLMLAETHRQCRCLMSRQLISGCNPHECLRARPAGTGFGTMPGPSFSRLAIENDYHI